MCNIIICNDGKLSKYIGNFIRRKRIENWKTDRNLDHLAEMKIQGVKDQ